LVLGSHGAKSEAYEVPAHNFAVRLRHLYKTQANVETLMQDLWREPGTMVMKRAGVRTFAREIALAYMEYKEGSRAYLKPDYALADWNLYMHVKVPEYYRLLHVYKYKAGYEGNLPAIMRYASHFVSRNYSKTIRRGLQMFLIREGTSEASLKRRWVFLRRLFSALNAVSGDADSFPPEADAEIRRGVSGSTTLSVDDYLEADVVVS
jgi:hypothetical protein